MLGLVLAWPAVFHGGSSGIDVGMAASSAAPALVPSAVAATTRSDAPVMLSVAVPPSRLENCEAAFARAERLCRRGAACLAGASDHYDLCQATGLWRD